MRLKNREDQTPILQTGRPVAVMNTHPVAPMVMSVVNNTVEVWANENKFYELFKEGKTIWCGITAATRYRYSKKTARSSEI